MRGYAIQKGLACAKSTESISPKSAVKVARAVNGMKLPDAKKFLKALIDGRVSIKNKFYTKSAERLLNVIVSAEKNAERKNANTDSLTLNISVHKGPRRIRARRSRRFGMQLKLSNVQVVLLEDSKKG